MDNDDWHCDFKRMLAAYNLTTHDIHAALPRVLCSLSPDEVKTVDGADWDHPERMTEEQARIVCVLMVRAAALLATEWAERERSRRGSAN